MAAQDAADADSRATELRDLARQLVDSWNRRDSQAFAGLFTTGAEYVTGAGERFQGRQAIAQLLEKAAPAPRVRLVVGPVVESHTRQGKVHFEWSTVEASAVARHGRITCTCVRHGSAWLIEALRNVDVEPPGDSRATRSTS